MKSCTACGASFEVTEKDRQFLKKVSPKIDGENLVIPAPEKCPNCRMQQRMCFRNERNLYRRKSDLSQKPMISIYHESSPHKVFSATEWWSDAWDGLDAGRDFDFGRSFFEQFAELLKDVPRIGLFNVNPTNSEYCQQAYNNKNCYLCTVITECEDCQNISHTNKAVDCYDCDYLQNCQLCFGCLDSDKLYGCVDCQSCQTSNDCIFCYDCIGCTDCFGCFGLRKKEFHFFNEPCSKEKYFEKLKNLELGNREKFEMYRREFQKALTSAPQRESWNLKCENCTGNYLINAKNGEFCFDSFEIQDCKNCTWIFESHDIQDVYGLGKSDWLYNCLGNENAHTGAFNTFVSDSSDAYYSDCCFYSQNLFGCTGLRNKKFCIFNKKYSPEDYSALVRKIVEHMKSTGEWGKFFPAKLSPFGYDESVAFENFPIEKPNAIAKNFPWSGHKKPLPAAKKIITTEEFPKKIENANDEILNVAIKCEKSGKLFQITKKELKFFKTYNLPIPSVHPDVRYADRMAKRNPRKMHDRRCAECQSEILTTFATNRPEEIFCHACYLKKIY